MSVPPVKLTGRVAVVTGGSRGIGRECCLLLARNGCNIAILAKSTEETPNLPGTIYSVAAECRALGVQALPLQVDVRDDEQINKAVSAIVKEFGRIDILINNASALWWQNIVDTPMKKFDLIVSINARGTFALTRACLPHMKANGFGRIVCMSPPISLSGFKGHTAYNISKFGMTMVALGVAEEYKGQGISANSLWPATIVESQASKNFQMSDSKMWRKASILADCVLGLVGEGPEFSGNMLIDDVYLTERHKFKPEDFVKYRFDPDIEPPRFLAHADWPVLNRGSIQDLKKDQQKSRL